MIANYEKLLITCGDSTAENTDFVEWGLRVDLRGTTGMDHGVLTKGGSPNKVENGLPLNREP